MSWMNEYRYFSKYLYFYLSIESEYLFIFFKGCRGVFTLASFMLAHFNSWLRDPAEEVATAEPAVTSDLDPAQARAVNGWSEPASVARGAAHDCCATATHSSREVPSARFSTDLPFRRIVFAWRSGFAVNGFRSHQEMQISASKMLICVSISCGLLLIDLRSSTV